MLSAFTGFAGDVKNRGVLVCVGENASGPIRKAAQELAAGAQGVPALRALIKTQGPSGPVRLVPGETLMIRDPRRSDRFEGKAFEQAAYNHLVVIGLASSDPLVKQVWDVGAAVDEKAKTIYMEGYGAIQGDVGYIESTRNPFLHSQQMPSATFDTCLFRISGTSEAGVLAAVKAFRGGMLNGLVPAGNIARPEKTILDLDPSVEACPLPFPRSVTIPGNENKNGKAFLAGWTQAAANEYRAYLDRGGHEPDRVWRLKYLRPDNFNRIDPEVWSCGFHRKAWGNAVTVARFASQEDAADVVKSIRNEGKNWKQLSLAGLEFWETAQPGDEVFKSSSGSVFAGAVGKYVVLSSLPAKATEGLLKAVGTSNDKGSR